MAAITAAEQGVRRVLVLEGTPEPLQKVRISGGGRCNVTHACWDPRELATHYPRGSRPLRGPSVASPAAMRSPGLTSMGSRWWRNPMDGCFRSRTVLRP